MIHSMVLLGSFFVGAVAVQNQEGDVVWSNQSGGSQWDRGFRSVLRGDGSIVVAREDAPTEGGIGTHCVDIYESDGTLRSTVPLVIGGSGQVLGIAVGPGDRFAISGMTNGTLPGEISSGSSDAFLIVFEADGTVAFNRQIGSSAFDRSFAVAFDSAGNVYVGGHTLGALPGESSSGGEDAFLRRYDSAGVEVWTAQFGTGATDAVLSLAVSPDAKLYVGGSSWANISGQGYFGQEDAVLWKFELHGALLWTRQFGSSGRDQSYSLDVPAADEIYVVGTTTGVIPGESGSGGRDAVIARYDSDGNIDWIEQFGSSGRDDAHASAVDEEGTIYVTGFTDGALDGQTPFGGFDVFLRKMNSDSTHVETYTYGTSTDDIGWDIAGVSSGILYLSGQTAGSFNGGISLGNSDAVLAAIRIIPDTTPPQVTPPPDTMIPEGVAAFSIGQATVSDDTDPSPVVSSDAPESFEIGLTVVTWTATDASGNSATATQNVTVVDANVGPGVSVGSGLTLGSGVRFKSGATVGNNVVLGDNVVVGINTVVGDDVIALAGSLIKKGAQVGMGSSIGQDAIVGENVVLGAGVLLGTGSHVKKGAVVGAGSVIGADALIGLSVTLGTHVEVGGNSIIRINSIIGDSARIGWDVELKDGVHIGDQVEIGDRTFVKVKATIGAVPFTGSAGTPTKVGADVTVNKNLSIGDEVSIGDGETITADIPEGTTIGGAPTPPTAP